MIITKEDGKTCLDYEGQYPIEPVIIISGDIIIKNAIFKRNGYKAPILTSIKSAILAYKNVRYGQFFPNEYTTYKTTK